MIETLRVGRLVVFLTMLLFLPLMALAADSPDFAVIGEIHLGYNETIYKAFLAKIDEEKVKTFIVVGNAIYHGGSEEEWKRFLDLAGPGRMVHIAPGNQDLNNFKGLRVYKKMVNKPPYYSFAVEDTQFLILCSAMPGTLYKITGKQLEWLEEELEKPFKRRIVFVHMPLFPTSAGQGYGLDKYGEERDALHELFVEHGVNIVFQGHQHLYNRTVKDGVTYVITGGGGARLLNTREESGGYFHYILAKKREEGYVFTVYNVQVGSKKDEFFLK